LVSCCTGASPALRQERPLPCSLAQKGPRGVEVLLGALGPGTQLTARLLEHLRAGFHRGAQLVAEHGVPYKVILNNIDPRLGADEIRAAWELLDGGGLARFRCAVRAYRAYSTAQANRQTVIQFKGRYAANAREDVKRVHTELLLDLGRIAAGKDVS
jgi:hypothetical protein